MYENRDPLVIHRKDEKVLSGPTECLPIHKRLQTVQKCRGCGKMLKSRKKYYLLPEPKIFNTGQWVIVKVCQHKTLHPNGTFTLCGTHNYRRIEE